MRIIVARGAGFCFGVKRAVDGVASLTNAGKEVYTIGELIHNGSVLERLKEDGVKCVELPSQIPAGGHAVIRSHGVPPEYYDMLDERGIEYTDLTCPFVARIHSRVYAARDEYDAIVIVGKAEHPEVIGTKGWAGKKGVVISSADELSGFHTGRALVVAQTTITRAQLDEVYAEVKRRSDETELFMSICETTSRRQKEAAELARISDAVLVVGDRQSSNTAKLTKIASEYCKNVQFIEFLDELILENYVNCDIISIVAGASTPDWIIREVKRHMSELNQVQGPEDAVKDVNDAAEAVVEAVEAEVTQTAEAVIETVTEEAVEPAEEAAEMPAVDEVPVDNAEAEAPAEEAEAETAEAPAEEAAAEVAEAPAEEADAEAAEAPAEEAEAEAAEVPAEEAKAEAAEAPAEEAAADEAPEKEANAEADKAAVSTEEASEKPAAEQGEEDFLTELEKTFKKIRRGQFINGTVVQVSDDEVCVNIGYKSDGIIKRENLALEEGKTPQESFKPGDEIRAEVITLNDGEGNVSLSRKKVENQLKWKQYVDELEEDKIYSCKVLKAIKGGVLSKLDGYDAFIPASQLSLKYVEDLSTFTGQTLEVKIIDVDKRQKRFVLSHKEVLKARAEEEERKLFETFEKGAIIKGVVKRLTDFGAFVDVGGVDGLLHITDISWVRIKHPKEVLEENQEIEVKIINVDPEKKKISLGYKQLQPKPWDIAPQKYLVGDVVEGKVVRIAPFGAFVELEPTIDGLVHISQVANRRVEKVEDVLSLGQVVTAKILEVNAEKRRISLSIRAIIIDEQPAQEEKNEREGGKKHEKRDDDHFSYVIPPVEEATSSLADFFPKPED